MLDILFLILIISLVGSITTAIENRNRLKHLKASNDPDKFIKVARHYKDKNKYKEAFTWFDKAAEKELPEALYELSMCYDMGYGCGQDKEKAFRICSKSAEKGFRKAQSRMGYYYENGVGTTMDKIQAVYWYGEAAKNGDKLSEARLKKIESELQEKSK